MPRPRYLQLLRNIYNRDRYTMQAPRRRDAIYRVSPVALPTLVVRATWLP